MGGVAKETGQPPQFFHSAVSTFSRHSTAILKMHHFILDRRAKYPLSKCENTCLLRTEPKMQIWVSVLPLRRSTPSASGQLLWGESCTLLHNTTSALSRASCQPLEDPSSWKTTYFSRSALQTERKSVECGKTREIAQQREDNRVCKRYFLLDHSYRVSGIIGRNPPHTHAPPHSLILLK